METGFIYESYNKKHISAMIFYYFMYYRIIYE